MVLIKNRRRKEELDMRIKIKEKRDSYQITFKQGFVTISTQLIDKELLPIFLISNGLASFPGQRLPSDVLQRSLRILKENLWEVQGLPQ